MSQPTQTMDISENEEKFIMELLTNTEEVSEPVKSLASVDVFYPSTLMAKDVEFLAYGKDLRRYLVPKYHGKNIRLAIPSLDTVRLEETTHSDGKIGHVAYLPLQQMLESSNPTIRAEGQRLQLLLNAIRYKAWVETIAPEDASNVDFRGPSYPELLMSIEKDEITEAYKSWMERDTEDVVATTSTGKSKQSRSRQVPCLEFKSITIRPYHMRDNVRFSSYIHLALRLTYPYTEQSRALVVLPKFRDDVPQYVRVSKKEAVDVADALEQEAAALTTPPRPPRTDAELMPPPAPRAKSVEKPRLKRARKESSEENK